MFVRHTSVEAGESKTDETVSVGILYERLRDLVGKFDGLVLDCNTSNSDSISTDSTSSTGAIAVTDFELGTIGLFEGS
jgi:hypothetical protein